MCGDGSTNSCSNFDAKTVFKNGRRMVIWFLQRVEHLRAPSHGCHRQRSNLSCQTKSDRQHPRRRTSNRIWDSPTRTDARASDIRSLLTFCSMFATASAQALSTKTAETQAKPRIFKLRILTHEHRPAVQDLVDVYEHPRASWRDAMRIPPDAALQLLCNRISATEAFSGHPPLERGCAVRRRAQ